MNKSDAHRPLRVYYDGSCPLCRTEMQGLKARDHAGRLELVDCSSPGFTDADLDAAGISVEHAMQRIHARDAHGRWFDGVRVFELAYGAAGMKRTAKALGNRRLRPLFDRLYPIVARNRRLLTRLGLAGLLGRVLRRR